jgi:TP53 regulating kinase-like protein
MATPVVGEVRLISRGAEAEVYLINFFGVKAVLKKRVSKKYRNSLFDQLFIRNRTLIEAKVLAELYESGLRVPAVLFVDEESGVLIIEYIDGIRVSDLFEELSQEKKLEIARLAGEFAGKMHSKGIFHGDYTLANILLSPSGVYFIDFGLSGYSTDIEEYAIDLHLMARSIQALAPKYKDSLVGAMIEEYTKYYVGDAREVILRMKEISVRGRYVDRELRKSLARERYIG